MERRSTRPPTLPTRRPFQRAFRAARPASRVVVRAAGDVPKGVTMPPVQPTVPPATFGFVDNAERMNSRAAMVRVVVWCIYVLVCMHGLNLGFKREDCVWRLWPTHAEAAPHQQGASSGSGSSTYGSCDHDTHSWLSSSAVPASTPQTPHARTRTLTHPLKPAHSLPAQIGFFSLILVEVIIGKGLLEAIGLTVGQGLGFEF